MEEKKFRIPRNLMWGLGVIALVAAFVAFLVIFMSSSESTGAFLAKWKSAMESGDPKKYEALWVKNARQHPATNYQKTASLMRENVRFEVDLGSANPAYRVPRYTNRYRIEGVSVAVYYPGEVQQQLRNVVIEKKGLIQQRWKVVQEEIVGGSEMTATLSPPDAIDPPAATLPPDSPVAPLVTSWQSALRSQNLQAYTDLWDKSARNKRTSGFSQASALLSQTHIIDMSGVGHRMVPGNKNRYIVDNIQVSLESGGTPIETHLRTLTIEKKGFFWRNWKLIGDQISAATDAVAVAPDAANSNSVSGEEGGGTFDGKAPIDTHLKVRQVLGKWQTAWESKDVSTYMSIYSDRAQITRVTVRDGRETSVYLTKGQLRSNMEKLNTLYADIQISISNLQVNGDHAVADVKFLQKFKGTPASGSRPAYSDYGTKKLNLMVDPADGHWRIYGETWSRYEDVPDFPKM